MMTTIYLSAEEKLLFEKLPETLRDGWITEEETKTADDTFEQRLVRMQLMHLRDPKLQAILKLVSESSSIDQVVNVIQSQDLTHIDNADLSELFFALGPTVISALILFLLKSVKTDKDIEGIVALTLIRNKLLVAFNL